MKPTKSSTLRQHVFCAKKSIVVPWCLVDASSLWCKPRSLGPKVLGNHVQMLPTR